MVCEIRVVFLERGIWTASWTESVEATRDRGAPALR